MGGNKIEVSRLQKATCFFLRPGDKLSQRVVHAGFWAFALRVTDRLFGLTRIIVLARLLSPKDFGLFGIALIALSALDTFSQTGFQAALVQKKGDIKPYLDTAWTVQVIRGFVLAGILFGIAPYVASFFGEPAAALLLRVLGLSAVFQGLTNIGVVYFQKELEFHKRFIYMFSGTLADLGVAIPAALILRNAWALVFGLLAGNFVRMAVSYFIHPYRPKVWLDGPKVKELYTFGRWVFGQTIVAFLSTKIDSIFVGKLLEATFLGIYQMAFRLSNLMIPEIANIISKVAFPAYSALQDDVGRLKQAFLQILEITMAVSLPLTVGILILGPDFVRLLLGNTWTPMIPALQILAVSALMHSLITLGSPLFLGIGYPNVDFVMYMVRGGVMAIAIYPLTKFYGIYGAATSVVLGIVSAIPVWWYFSIHTIKVSSVEIIERLALSLVGTGIMTLLILFIKWVLVPIGFGDFILSGLVGAIGYMLFQFLLWKKLHRGPITAIQLLFRK